MRLSTILSLCAVVSMPSVLTADTLTIRGGGEVITFSLAPLPRTVPGFVGDSNALQDSFSVFNGFNVNVNGVDFATDELLFGRNQIVLPDILCSGPINIYDPCVFTIAFDNGSIDGIGNPAPLFNGPNTDPELNLGKYAGYSGSGVPPYGTLETLTMSSSTTPVPEPTNIFLFSTGLLLLVAMARRKPDRSVTRLLRREPRTS